MRFQDAKAEKQLIWSRTTLLLWDVQGVYGGFSCVLSIGLGYWRR